MRARLAVAATMVVLALAACSAGEDAAESDGTWVGTITTEGNVTSVVNESGSLWGGTATLVEEASIGVDVGAAEYMFGDVAGLAASNDRIYVIDRSVPAVRIYDYGGLYVGDLGRSGEGPGEYRSPVDIAVGHDGTVFVRDVGPQRITAYRPDGTVVSTIPQTTYTQTLFPMVVTPDGVAWVRDSIETDGGDDPASGMVPYATEDTGRNPIIPPSFDEEPALLVARGTSGRILTSSPVPFTPAVTWAMAPSGAIVAGLPTTYRFERHDPDGRVLVIESHRDAVAVLDEEAAWHRRRMTAFFRSGTPDWSWNGPDIPTTKPPYTAFVPGHAGALWVLGPGAGEHVAGCTEDPQPRERVTPCWREETTVDVFDASGRYLGPVELPDGLGLSPRSWIRDDTVVATSIDDAGTISVKRYRLALPGDSE
jgi:hypothetical protein